MLNDAFFVAVGFVLFVALLGYLGVPKMLGKSLDERGQKIQLVQRHKAESDLAVAAASIFAREKFVNWLDDTGKRSGVTLPKGASAAVKEAGREIVRQHGAEALGRFAKAWRAFAAALSRRRGPDDRDRRRQKSARQSQQLSV